MSGERTEAAARKEIDRAAQAERLMRDPLFIEAVEAVKDHVWTEMMQPITEGYAEKALEARRQMDALDRMLKFFRDVVSTGTMARSEFDDDGKYNPNRGAPL